jgi:BirA family biotin operon repressor/biotin-[acetyl-CoA-carboxylase] ligase
VSFYLSSYARDAGYRVKSFGRVDSTNILAGTFAKEREKGQLWIVATEQIAGRGRRGRQWISSAGNLYTTLLLVDDFEPGKLASLGFVAGISLIEALRCVLPQALQNVLSVTLKWPNDVLIGGDKLAGILLEMIPLKDHMNGILVGIGVNIVSSPVNCSYATASLIEKGVNCSPEMFFEALSYTWVDNYRLWNRGFSLEAIRNRWLSYASGLGQKISVKLHSEIISGVFETIDRKCQLILRKLNGQQVIIPAGDVYFGAVTSASFDF